MSLKRHFKKVADAAWFQNTITFCILLAGIVVGIETYPSAVEAYGGPLHLINQIILWVFVAEIVVKVGAEGKKPWRYFYDPWNVFDFAIVAVCFMPIDAQYVAVLRLARLLRLLRLAVTVAVAAMGAKPQQRPRREQGQQVEQLTRRRKRRRFRRNCGRLMI